jgi:hypothetical protein
MSTRSRDPKGDVRHRPAADPMQAHPPYQDANHDVVIQRDLLGDYQQLARLLDQLVNWDFGYFKLRRATLGGELHLTWTWTLGVHSGSYVYVRVQYWQLTYGLELLSSKVFQVQEGKLIPTVDKRGSRHYTA